MADSLEYILSCQICLEDFEESGDHVPRLLPCTHSLCEICLKQLIQGAFVECPECRKKHRVVNQVRTFPQNKYILANIRRKQAEILKDRTSKPVNICDKHGKELSLYCKEPECQRVICQTCLTRHHRGHDVVETEEIEKETLLEKMEKVIKDLQERKENILEIKKNAESINTECSQKITAHREKLIHMINQTFETMLTEVGRKGQNDVTEKLTIIEEHLDLLQNIKDNVDKEVITHEEIEADMKTINSVEQNIKDQLSREVGYKMFHFEEVKPISEEIKRLCGHLEGSTKYVRLTAEENNVPYSWKVVNSIQTDVLTSIESLAPIEGTCIAILDGGTRLLKNRCCSGEKVQEIQLDHKARSIVAVELAGRSCLAVTYATEGRIEFRDAKDFNTVVLDLSVAPHRPIAICAASNSSLWYESYTYLYSELHQLDCSSYPWLTSPAISCSAAVFDMCCAEFEGRSFLFMGCSHNGLETYNTNAGEREWSVQGEIPFSEINLDAKHITTDARGHLFVHDEENKCIHIFSLNGKYVMTLLREGEQNLGELHTICWSQELSGLIVAHRKDNKSWISLIKIQ